jgi:hypothetical protein
LDLGDETMSRDVADITSKNVGVLHLECCENEEGIAVKELLRMEGQVLKLPAQQD